MHYTVLGQTWSSGKNYVECTATDTEHPDLHGGKRRDLRAQREALLVEEVPGRRHEARGLQEVVHHGPVPGRGRNGFRGRFRECEWWFRFILV